MRRGGKGRGRGREKDGRVGKERGKVSTAATGEAGCSRVMGKGGRVRREGKGRRKGLNAATGGERKKREKIN